MPATAILLPCATDEKTLETVIEQAISADLVACNTTRGRFYIGLFPRQRIPKGWAPLGCAASRRVFPGRIMPGPGQ